MKNDLPSRHINDPLLGIYHSLSFLPATPPSQIPWRAFWADTAPLKGHRLPLCAASWTTEKKGHWLGAEVPGHSQEQLTQTNWLLKAHIFSLFTKLGGPDYRWAKWLTEPNFQLTAVIAIDWMTEKWRKNNWSLYYLEEQGKLTLKRWLWDLAFVDFCSHALLILGN